jgi:hypothetical protein
MSDQPSSNSKLPTFLGSLGAILIFALIIFLAYLPNRPQPIDQSIAAARQAKADEARAAGIAKISKYAVNGDGSIQIPVDAAMEIVVKNYNN